MCRARSGAYPDILSFYSDIIFVNCQIGDYASCHVSSSFALLHTISLSTAKCSDVVLWFATSFGLQLH